MPAAAVIPAPIAYIKVVAVKKLVVGLWGVFFSRTRSAGMVCTGPTTLPSGLLPFALNWVRGQLQIVYFEKIRVFKAGKSRLEYISMG